MLAALSVLSSCTSPETQLSEIAAHPRDFNGRVVTTCGWATNEFEDLNLTVDHEGAARDGAKGLAVEWCENSAETRGPVRQCVTGTIEPGYGQSADEADRKPGTNFAISTGVTLRVVDTPALPRVGDGNRPKAAASVAFRFTRKPTFG